MAPTPAANYLPRHLPRNLPRTFPAYHGTPTLTLMLTPGAVDRGCHDIPWGCHGVPDAVAVVAAGGTVVYHGTHGIYATVPPTAGHGILCHAMGCRGDAMVCHGWYHDGNATRRHATKNSNGVYTTLLSSEQQASRYRKRRQTMLLRTPDQTTLALLAPPLVIEAADHREVY